MISQEFNIEEANEKQQKQKTNSRKKYKISFQEKYIFKFWVRLSVLWR